MCHAVPLQHKSRVMQDHRVYNYLNTAQTKSAELLEAYEDKSGYGVYTHNNDHTDPPLTNRVFLVV